MEISNLSTVFPPIQVFPALNVGAKIRAILLRDTFLFGKSLNVLGGGVVVVPFIVLSFLFFFFVSLSMIVYQLACAQAITSVVQSLTTTKQDKYLSPSRALITNLPASHRDAEPLKNKNRESTQSLLW